MAQPSTADDRPVPAAAETEDRWARLERRVRESVDEFWDRYVDPADPLEDEDGLRWTAMNDGPRGGDSVLQEPQLRQLRAECRALAATNEFAINGHENRISYIVGTGHAYRVSARCGQEPLALEVQAVLDAFLRHNGWHKRQQEIVRRKDRDGECFIRLFPASDGIPRVRFVEPDQVATPAEAATDPAARFGVVTDRRDVETVYGYYVDGAWVDADEIQHRKANVDANVKRGLPLFYPVRKNLRRAEKLLRNMSVVAEIQSAIAIIRKHASGGRAAVEQFVQREARSSTDPATGRTRHVRRYGPGTILDALAGTDYEFPAAGIDAGRYVTVLQAELRAIASRLVMPEFMLTSDASNANYASTMMAEGPAIKMFERLQHEMLEEDRELMGRVLRAAVAAGRLPAAALREVEIRGTPPTLAVRDRLHDARADEILVRSGAMSIQTMALRHGLDSDRERELMAQRSASGPQTP